MNVFYHRSAHPKKWRFAARLQVTLGQWLPARLTSMAPEKELMNLVRVSEKKISLRGKPDRPDKNRDALAFEHPKGIFIGLVISQIDRQKPLERERFSGFL